jgi:hypothetical protein
MMVGEWAEECAEVKIESKKALYSVKGFDAKVFDLEDGIN